jgi:hypothetical protein
MIRKSVLLGIAILCSGGWAQAASVSFVPRELFHVPFGPHQDSLGERREGDNLIVPRDFTMDGSGHFYLYDINKHRIARYSFTGGYEMEFRYPATAEHLFAHADSHENLWLMISDPTQGMFFGVYDSRGRVLRSGIFSRFNHFKLHPDDNNVLHVILSSAQHPSETQTYIFDEKSLLMKKENIAPPPDSHHQVRQQDHLYFIDQVPGSAASGAPPVNRVTDETHHGVAELQGTVIYMTPAGEIYTRVGDREIRVYEAKGQLMGKVVLDGLSSACASIRFDPDGNMFELDGIPDKAGQYGADMPGMRLIEWQRQ